ncbi:MAG: cation:proton antiporter [Rhodobacteraceae bacterium]|jgi:CPA1 family monovalent cation:H+ antiporter|nr:cation:proton antiporter [Paracoccaceae bacterium]
MDIVVIVAVIAALFAVIALAEPLADRLRLPYTVMLAALGLAIAVGATLLLRAGAEVEGAEALSPAAFAILNLPIRSNVFLYVFLPTLIFQATLVMNLRRMADDWVPILVLAVVAVFVATAFVGGALSVTSTLPLAACLLIGAIVSTTDPSAVLTVFRSIAAPRRLARLVEGESVLNDAAAIALFGVFLSIVSVGVANPTWGEAALRFPVALAGGAAVGWLMARVWLWGTGLLGRRDMAIVSASVALPYLAFVAAEQLLGASGVIAVVTAGMTLNLLGPGRLPPGSWVNLRETWGLLAHWAGALIFVLAALLIPRLLGDLRLSDLGLVAVVTAAAITARVVVLFGLLPMLVGMRLSPPVSRPFRAVILWGGLRGAVTLALALAVTESFRVAPETKRLVGILATGFTLFTLFVQGPTLRLVIRSLRLDALSPIDAALSRQVVAVALQSVREAVATTAENYALTREITRSEAKRFAERLDEAVKAADEGGEILDRDRVTLGLIALAGAERDAYVERLRDRTISARISERLMSDADGLIEGTRADGRTGYQRAARRALGYGPGLKLAVWMHNRLRLPGLHARLTADRFELLLAQRLVLRDLHGFIDRRIRRIHGRRVADLLHEMLDRRIDTLDASVDGMRLQYPGYAEEIERRFLRRTALRLEERDYDALHGEGLIGEELHARLIEDVMDRRADAERRPALDLAARKEDLIRQIPAFDGLPEAQLKPLLRALVTRHVPEGAVVLRRDAPSETVFFIASGAVEVEVAGQTWRLGRGEMFGHIALLTRAVRRARVVAITPCTLLVLDQNRFLRLLARSPALRASVRASAEKRGLDPDRVLAERGPVTQPLPGMPVPDGAAPAPRAATIATSSAPPAPEAAVPTRPAEASPAAAPTTGPDASAPPHPDRPQERSWDGS